MFRQTSRHRRSRPPQGAARATSKCPSSQAPASRFLALSPKADPYYQALEHRRLNPRHHVTKIVALSEIYGTEATARAIEDALEFGAVSSEYIANLLESRARALPDPGVLHLTRRADLLELDLPEPDLDLYDTYHNDNHD